MSENPTPDTRHPIPESPPKAEETIKETIESIIIAFVLAFVFRAFVVEAFVIPTGSMAPTLLGEHLKLTCPDCGYTFDIQAPHPNQPVEPAICPMTGHPVPVPRRAVRAAGDRILVHKYLYRFSEPKRWDVVVFKNPAEPKINYIKRLVGLPNESLYLYEGNVYVAPYGADGEPDESRRRIARKTDRPPVQRAVWRPIYHSDYVPVDPNVSQAPPQAAFVWRCPWEPAEPGAWDMSVNHGRSYRYLGRGSGQLNFTFSHWPRMGDGDNVLNVMYSYNQLHDGGVDPDDMLEPIEDVRLAATVRPGSDAPLRLELRTTARLTGEAQPIAAVIEPDGQVRVIVGDPETGDAESYHGQTVTPLHERSAARVEFWFVDLEASVWINGKRVLRQPFDLDFTALRQRPTYGPVHRPQVRLLVTGGPAELHHVELDRDLFYAPSGNVNGYRTLARGALVRLGLQEKDNRLDIAPDEYFCLGDNSPLSHDGRFWGLANTERTDPWVRLRSFHNDPMKDGLVPRDLMMGRAFFVYWPAPYPLRKDGFGVLPNFGDMRFIH